MKPAPFDYVRPASLSEACRLRAEPGAAALAGGQSLVPLMALRKAQPSRIVDLGGLGALRQIETAASGETRIGALITHAALEDWEAPGPLPAFLREVARGIAFRSVRNLGTIGGSLAHADPRADWLCALIALSARVEMTGPDGARVLAVEDFIEGPGQTALDADALVTAALIPETSQALICVHAKLRPKVGAFADLLTAAAFDPATGLARVSLGGAAVTPRALPALSEALLRGGLAWASAVTRAKIEAALASEAGLDALDAVDRRRAAALIERCLHRLGERHAA